MVNVLAIAVAALCIPTIRNLPGYDRVVTKDFVPGRFNHENRGTVVRQQRMGQCGKGCPVYGTLENGSPCTTTESHDGQLHRNNNAAAASGSSIGGGRPHPTGLIHGVE